MKILKNNQSSNNKNKSNYFSVLDRGIDDMEAGRELPLEGAFQVISDFRDSRRRARS